MSEQSMSQEMASPRQRAIAYLEMRQSQRFGTGREKGVKTPIMPEKVRRPQPLVDTVTAYEKMIDNFGDKGYEGLKQKLEDMRPAAYDAARFVQWGAKLADYAVTTLMWMPETWTVLKKAIPAKPGVAPTAAIPGVAEIKSGPFVIRKGRAPIAATPGSPAVAAQPAVTVFDKMPSKMGDAFQYLRAKEPGRGRIKLLATVGVLRFRPVEWIGGKAAQLGGAVLSSDIVAPVVNAILQGGERVQPTKEVAPVTPAAT